MNPVESVNADEGWGLVVGDSAASTSSNLSVTCVPTRAARCASGQVSATHHVNLNHSPKITPYDESANKFTLVKKVHQAKNAVSPFWVFFHIYDPSEHSDKSHLANCNYCGADISFKNGTGGLSRHIAALHSFAYDFVDADYLRKTKRKKIDGEGTKRGMKAIKKTKGKVDVSAHTDPSIALAEPNSGVCAKIAFIGSGTKAEAIITPLIKKRLQPARHISVFDVTNSCTNKMTDKYCVQGAESIYECIQNADIIICAVKPQDCDSVFTGMRESKDAIHPDATMLTIVAGKSISCFQASGISRIARSIPDIPSTFGKGVTVWTCTPNLCENFRRKIKDILCCFGRSIYVDDEKLIDIATSMSGSSPACIFMLMEAMIDAGVHMGFNREIATTLTHHALLGSALYAMDTGLHPAILKNMVTRPAGTAASALYELEKGRFHTVIKDAIWASYRRELEMDGSNSNVGPARQQRTVFAAYRAQSGEMEENNSVENTKETD